eukprot:scaffold144404_cov26-Tisochrysis_lutea.AAC.1
MNWAIEAVARVGAVGWRARDEMLGEAARWESMEVAHRASPRTDAADHGGWPSRVWTVAGRYSRPENVGMAIGTTRRGSMSQMSPVVAATTRRPKDGPGCIWTVAIGAVAEREATNEATTQSVGGARGSRARRMPSDPPARMIGVDESAAKLVMQQLEPAGRESLRRKERKLRGQRRGGHGLLEPCGCMRGSWIDPSWAV